MTSVVVTQPIGSTSFSGATADLFEPDVLTVTSLDPDALLKPWQVFHGLAWIEATVYDAGGNVAFAFQNQRAQEAQANALARLRLEPAAFDAFTREQQKEMAHAD